MPSRPLDAEEAEILFRAIAGADLVAGPGRDVYYEIHRANGDVAEGVLAEKNDDGVTLTDADDGGGRSTVTWDDIHEVVVRGYN
jgi:hypothetical protein